MSSTHNFSAPFPVVLITDANGNATGFAERSALGAQKRRPLYGQIDKVTYTPAAVNPLDPGFTLTITLETTGEAVLSGSGPGPWYPRSRLTDTASGQDLVAGMDPDSNPAYQAGMIYIGGDRIKIVVAAGGALKNGTVTIFVR